MLDESSPFQYLVECKFSCHSIIHRKCTFNSIYSIQSLRQSPSLTVVAEVLNAAKEVSMSVDKDAKDR